MREKKLNLSPSPGDEVKTTTCYMCACRCGIKVWLTDGKIRYIQGNPAHPVNQGVLCAKGAAGIMQHYSPARLNKPMLRVGERGSGEFKEIEWDEALQLATEWLKPIRERNPDELAFFTGRDQSQALTGWWAQQFGTINYAAHGGFCSVNMAAGGLYTLGGSFKRSASSGSAGLAQLGTSPPDGTSSPRELLRSQLNVARCVAMATPWLLESFQHPSYIPFGRSSSISETVRRRRGSQISTVPKKMSAGRCRALQPSPGRAHLLVRRGPEYSGSLPDS